MQTLVIGPNLEVCIPRHDMESIPPSQMFVMRAGLKEQLTPQEFADLVTFLQACK